MNRLPLIAAEEVQDPALRRVFTAAAANHGAVPDLYRALAHAPAMLDAWVAMAWPLRSEPKTPRGLRELIIMRAAQVTGALYEWSHHWSMALDAGVPREKLLALSSWESSSGFSAEERAALAYAEQVLADGHVDDDVFSGLATLFEPQEIVEITLTASFYAHVARVLLALRIQPEPEYASVKEGWT